MTHCPDCHQVRRPVGMHICLAAAKTKRLAQLAPALSREEIEVCLKRGAKDAAAMFERLNGMFWRG